MMKAFLGTLYLVSGFFMLSLHAETLDAPTLVYKEYSDYIGRQAPKVGRQAASEIRSVRAYLASHMGSIPAHKIERLSRLIVRLARKHRIPAGLILSVIKVESNFQPWAVSPRGALGLMQLMPDTGEWLARRYAIEWNGPASLLDEETNTLIGVKYLAYLKDKYSGDFQKILSAYNRGPAKVDEEVSEGRSVTTLGYYEKIKEYLPKFALGSKTASATLPHRVD